MKFELGFPNEGWNDQINCLLVPIPGTDKCIFVERWNGDRFAIHTQGNWHIEDNILMAVALVHDLINNYVTTSSPAAQAQAVVTTGGNHEEQTHTEA